VRRFYTAVSVTAEGGISLDGRPVKTPRKAPLVLPTPALAEAVAGEWRAQGETVRPATMILTKLANTAIDRVRPERARIIAEMTEYAGSDLVCYRAESPEELVKRQAAAWDPVLDWARVALDAPFRSFPGLMHRPQADAALRAVSRHFAAADDFTLTAIHNLMTLSGSALLAAMAAADAIAPAAAWQAAHVDEDYQIEYWGEDSEARERRALRWTEFAASCRFLELLRRL